MLKRFIWKKLWKNGNFTLLNKPLEPIKLLQALSTQRLNFSHLNKHKFCHNFRDTANQFCLCNAETETTSQYLLRWPLFSEQRTKLFESLSNLDDTLLNHCDDDIVNTLLYVSSKYSFPMNSNHLLLSF